MIRKAVTPSGKEVPKLMDAKVEKPIKVAFVCMFEGWTSSQRMMDFLMHVP